MRRRDFITLLGGATAWPLAAHAQQMATPVIGFLAPVQLNEELLRGFRQGLKEVGFVEGENVSVLYRSAENQFDRLPALAAELVRRRVAVIATSGSPAVAFAAKAASATIPIVLVLNASNSREINAAFATFVRERPDALFVSIGSFFTARRVQLATLAARHMVPMTSGNRQITETGGLMSYGANITEAMRQVGVYAGRLLKGKKPADLPVVQSSKFELVINAETARMLGLIVPPTLLSIADEVIE
jgi:putative ABC transport system substrate-binding protein